MERDLQLQHDIHNSLDRISEQLPAFEEWNRQLTVFAKENNIKIPNSYTPYVFAEYIKTHIERTRSALNKHYKSKP